MSLAKRLHSAVERKKSTVITHVETVAEIHDFIDTHPQENMTSQPIACEYMCVISITPSNCGWRCVLTDKDAAGDGFPDVKRDFDKLKYREQAEFAFRLTIWRGKKHPRRQPDLVEGKTAYIREVTDVKSTTTRAKASPTWTTSSMKRTKR